MKGAAKMMTTTRGMVIVSILYWLLGMHFFMHNPGAGLYLPFNAWGWIFASLVIAPRSVAGDAAPAVGDLILAAGALAGGLAVVVAHDPSRLRAPGLRHSRLLGLFAGLLFLASLYQWRLERPTRDRLLYLLLGAVAIEALLGLVQYYLLTPGNWIGYDIRANRPTASSSKPNVMASFMATGLALAIWLELRKEGNPWLQGCAIGVIVSTSLLLVVLQSRVGQLGGLLALILLVPQLYRQRQLGRMLGLAGLGIALGLLSSMGWRSKRGLEIYQSGGMRSIYWPYAAKLIAEAPWTGWGYGKVSESVFLQHYMADKAQHPAMVQIEYNLDHPTTKFLYWRWRGASPHARHGAGMGRCCGG